MNIIEKYRPINSKEKVDSLISTQRQIYTKVSDTFV